MQDLISGEENTNLRVLGQNESFQNSIKFKFLKNNCGNKKNKINADVKNKYIGLTSKSSYMAFLEKNNIFDPNLLQNKNDETNIASKKEKQNKDIIQDDDSLSKNQTSSEDTYVASQSPKEDNSQLIENKIIELDISEKDNDLEPPLIKCNQKNIKTNKNFVEIKCQIQDESNLIALVVDRESISPNKNFEHKVQVPIGDSEIKVQALDEYGNKSDYVVSIQREFFDFFEKQEDLERLMPGGIQVSKNENRIAVIFGIKGYQSIPDTKYADKDAYAFIDYASYNLGISPRNIKYYINQDASYFNILDLESWLSNRINERTEVFVFYSGHGLNNNGEAIILPYDFRKTQIERSSIEKNTFIEEILGYQPGHVYAFFDACFSGLGRENESLIEGLRNISIVEEEKINKVTIFNSSSGAEFSSDLDEAEHGLFSYYLMKGLEGNADLNQDQKITTNELYSYVEDNVSTKALSIGFTQNPSLITSENKVILKW